MVADDARAGFVGLASAHDAGDLARAVIESVAWEVARCLEAVTSGRARRGPPGGGLTLGGAGTGIPLWVDVADLGDRRCRPPGGARARRPRPAPPCWPPGPSATELLLDRLDPVVAEVEPDPGAVARYRELRATADRVAWPPSDLGLRPAVTTGAP